MQFVNGMNTSYVQIRNELASEQLIKVQFQVAMSGRYKSYRQFFSYYKKREHFGFRKNLVYSISFSLSKNNYF